MSWIRQEAICHTPTPTVVFQLLVARCTVTHLAPERICAQGPYILLHLKSLSSSTTYHPDSHPPRSSLIRDVNSFVQGKHPCNICRDSSPLYPGLVTNCHQAHHTRVYTSTVCSPSNVISIHDYRPLVTISIATSHVVLVMCPHVNLCHDIPT